MLARSADRSFDERLQRKYINAALLQLYTERHLDMIPCSLQILSRHRAKFRSDSVC